MDSGDETENASTAVEKRDDVLMSDIKVSW